VLVVGSGEVLASSHTSRLIPPVDPGDVLARPAGPAYDAIVRIAPPYTTIEHGIGAFGLAVGLDGARWRAYALPIGRQGAAGEPAYVLTIASLRDIDESIATARRLVPLLALVGSLFILIARLVLANRALRPVAALTETAAGIARAHALGRRVPVGNRRDELGQMARTFNAMLDTIEQTYVAQQRFVADASHELRTPLTAVVANLDLLEHQPGLPSEEREEAVREASRETRRLVRLVSGLLSLARADAGATLLRDAVEFDRVVMEAVAEASRLEGPPNVDVDTLEPVCIDGERDQLKQLVIILLDNAVKFTLVMARWWSLCYVGPTSLNSGCETLASVSPTRTFRASSSASIEGAACANTTWQGWGSDSRSRAGSRSLTAVRYSSRADKAKVLQQAWCCLSHPQAMAIP